MELGIGPNHQPIHAAKRQSGTVIQEWEAPLYQNKVYTELQSTIGERNYSSRIAELHGANSYHVNDKLSVLYLHVNERPGNGCPQMEVGAWGVDIKLFPIGPSDRECVIIPLLNGRGFTQHCVCLDCISIIVQCAEAEEKDLGEEIRRRLTVPMDIRTRNVVFW